MRWNDRDEHPISVWKCVYISHIANPECVYVQLHLTHMYLHRISTTTNAFFTPPRI